MKHSVKINYFYATAIKNKSKIFNKKKHNLNNLICHNIQQLLNVARFSLIKQIK